MRATLWDEPEEEDDWWGDTSQSASPIEHVYTPRGGCARGFHSRHPTVVTHGPAGTGKSLMWGNRIYQDAINYPRSRQLIVRKTRVSLTESFLTTWEEKVLGDFNRWPDHPLLRGASKAHRNAYYFPNGSVVVMAGMDNPTRIYSSEYDRVFVNECNELNSNEFYSLQRCLRNNVMPFQQLCGDTNPDDEAHFLFGDMNASRIYGIQTQHIDNPTLDPSNPYFDKAYLDRLEGLQGVLYDRLFLGLWVAAEGLAFPQYNRETHLVDRKVDLKYHAPDGFHRDANGELVFVDYFGGMDFGDTAPGALSIWGVDRDRRVFLIHEVYAAGMDLDWWAEWLATFHEIYNLRRVVADSAEPRTIRHMNQLLGPKGGRKGYGQLVVPAKKDARAQKDLLRWGLKSNVDGRARVFICRDTLEPTVGFRGEKPEPGVVQGLAQELPTLKLAEPTPKNLNPSDYAPECRDHATDGACYGLSGHFEKEYAQAKKGELYAPGTLGHHFGHERVLGLHPARETLARPGLSR